MAHRRGGQARHHRAGAVWRCGGFDVEMGVRCGTRGCPAAHLELVNWLRDNRAEAVALNEACDTSFSSLLSLPRRSASPARHLGPEEECARRGPKSRGRCGAAGSWGRSHPLSAPPAHPHPRGRPRAAGRSPSAVAWSSGLQEASSWWPWPSRRPNSASGGPGRAPGGPGGSEGKEGTSRDPPGASLPAFYRRRAPRGRPRRV